MSPLLAVGRWLLAIGYWPLAIDLLTRLADEVGSFPRYGRWKAEQAAKEERRKSRAERRARGEDVSEDEDGVEAGPSSLLVALGKMLLLILIGTALAGQFITGSPLWGYKGKWTNIHTYLAPFAVSRIKFASGDPCVLLSGL